MAKALLKVEVIKLRKSGYTYSEIFKKLGTKISKSTMSNWCKDLTLSKQQNDRIKKIIEKNIAKARSIALNNNREKREKEEALLIKENQRLGVIFKNSDMQKIALSTLYLAEGTKTRGGGLTLGNSDPFIIDLFLFLLRKCYNIDESKFRCTLQCRHDQNIKKLENFWSQLTGISLDQFYKARIDARTVNKPTKKKNYRGVLRINYFSARIYNELMMIPKIIHHGPIV